MIKHNISLQFYNTFKIDVIAKNLIEINSIENLKNYIQFNSFKYDNTLILGGGSNILFTKNFNGNILLNKLSGIQIIEENNNTVTLKVCSGVIWNDFVTYCIKNNYGGIENLSLIPGTVGAAPIQNIGAYGIEVKNTIISVECIELKTGKNYTFTNQKCKFDYRMSIFKLPENHQRFFITSVIFKLNKNPEINIQYKDIQEELKTLYKNQEITIKKVSQAIINIRTRKLPNLKKIGNAGSFFKNPIVEINFANTLKKTHANIPIYPLSNTHCKLSAGWLIEQAGWKNQTKYSNCGVFKNQALVIVNYGTASGQEIFQLSQDIIEDIQQKFNVTLQREINIY